jgi:gamma-glutamyltranspeptidase/glutathione hydrolase
MIDLARHGYKVGDEFEDTGERRSRAWRNGRRPRNCSSPDGSLIARGTFIQLISPLDLIAAARAPSTKDRLRKLSAAREAGGLMTADDLKNYKAVERLVLRGTIGAWASYRCRRPPLRRRAPDRDAQRVGGSKADDRPRRISWSRPCATPADRPAARRSGFRESADRRHAVSPRPSCALIDKNRATPSDKIRDADPAAFEGKNTTHFSIVDASNAVANTYTINLSYGVGLVAEGTGVLLNNELDDFAAAPGAPNAFGLVGFEANEPGPNKRPLSSMTPTIVLKNGKPFIVTGSPGGSRIITAVLQVLLNVIDYRMPLSEAVHAARVHHQWLPDETMFEPWASPAMMKALEARGHRVTIWQPFTSVQSIMVTPQGLIGAADTRTRGALAAGY